jgi:hypothetical protein
MSGTFQQIQIGRLNEKHEMELNEIIGYSYLVETRSNLRTLYRSYLHEKDYLIYFMFFAPCVVVILYNTNQRNAQFY